MSAHAIDFAAGTPARFAFNHSVGRMNDEQVNSMHRAILRPHIALVSKQFILVLPAQFDSANVLPLRPRLDARLCAKADADDALAAALVSAMITQLRKLRGRPSTMEIMTKAISSAASMPAMMKRPTFARA